MFLYRGLTALDSSSHKYWLFTLGALLRPGPPAGRDSHCQQLEPSRVQPGRPPSTGSRAGRVRAPMGGQHVWRMSGERSVVAAQPPPPDWHYRRLSGLSSTKEDGWLRNSLTSRPPLLLSCCLEGNPDNMKCDAWHFYWWLLTFERGQKGFSHWLYLKGFPKCTHYEGREPHFLGMALRQHNN